MFTVAAAAGQSQPINRVTLTAQASSDIPWVRVQIDDPYTRDAVKRTLTGAAEWLKASSCHSIFSEFKDERDLPLTVKLRELGATPLSYLEMMFVQDGSRHAACRKDGVLAFTAPGSRSIFVCGRDFERAARRDRRDAIAIIIHELLHSLGLGERPPEPRHITDRVRRSCWQ